MTNKEIELIINSRISDLQGIAADYHASGEESLATRMHGKTFELRVIRDILLNPALRKARLETASTSNPKLVGIEDKFTYQTSS